MKNGRAMKGHRRILVMIGTMIAVRRAPTGGWKVSCLCGWQGGTRPTSNLASLVYREHLDHIIDECPIRCKRCGEEKSLSQMRPDHRYICLKCFSKLGNQWQRANPVEATRHKRNYHLLNKYGITIEEYERMLEEQGGACAICDDDLSALVGDTPHVDHDHIAGRVRGITCPTCNLGLGAFKDDIRRLRAAISYLERNR